MTERIVAGGFVSTLSATLKRFIVLAFAWLQQRERRQFRADPSNGLPRAPQGRFPVDSMDGSA